MPWGHAHGPEPEELAGPGGWWRGLSAIVAVGLRPCSGAILVLVFALAQGLFWAGVASTYRDGTRHRDHGCRHRDPSGRRQVRREALCHCARRLRRARSARSRGRRRAHGDRVRRAAAHRLHGQRAASRFLNVCDAHSLFGGTGGLMLTCANSEKSRAPSSPFPVPKSTLRYSRRSEQRRSDCQGRLRRQRRILSGQARSLERRVKQMMAKVPADRRKIITTHEFLRLGRARALKSSAARSAVISDMHSANLIVGRLGVMSFLSLIGWWRSATCFAY